MSSSSGSGIPQVGDLVQTTAGTWITRPPSRCNQGHVLEPDQYVVGHVACLGHVGDGGHTTWHCLRCPNTEPPVYGPPLTANCTVLTGPAAVR